MLKHITNIIILAGGYGNRLSPLSTPEKPKQFLDLLDVGKTLYQQTLERAILLAEPRDVYTVTGKIHKIHAVLQAIEIGVKLTDNIMTENSPMNTAFSISYALTEIPRGIVVVMPSDHFIAGDFKLDMEKAIILAKRGKIVTLGIQPTHPDVGFGYILGDRFVEKPDMQTARDLIAQGALWNSGIFVFDADVMRDEIARYCPQIIDPISIDKAVMEKTEKLAVVKASFEWQDLGSFEAIESFRRSSKVA